MAAETLRAARPATSTICSRLPPAMSRSIALAPPMPRPNSEVCWKKPRVPGSRNAASRIGLMRSAARAGSTAEAPMMALARNAAKKNCSIFGRPSAVAAAGSPSSAQRSRVASSIRPAISVMVARL